jgi:opacity protein-like surface antigen
MRTRRLAAAGMAAVATMALAAAASAQDRTPAAQEGQTGQSGQTGPGPAAGITVPPADQPLIRRLPEPSISIEGGLGVLGYVAGAGQVGPGWNVRVTGALSPRLAVEGNYLGAVNQRAAVKRSLVLTSFDAGVRYNLMRADEAVVQPFVVAGVGYAGWAGKGGDAFALAVPITAGVERMVTRNIKLGARFNFRPAFFDDLTLPGGNRTGGDSWVLSGYGGGAF